jgi:hypothetical protein
LKVAGALTLSIAISVSISKINWFNYKFRNFETLQLCNFATQKQSTEKQNVKYSPDGADILPKSRRAREIKARAGQDGDWNGVVCFWKRIKKSCRWWWTAFGLYFVGNVMPIVG